MRSQQQVKELSPLERMIQQQVVERGIRDERVLDALRRVPRELFFPEDARKAAFADRAAPIGHGQTISQPYMVALMTHKLDVHEGHKVLEIGTGSGYQTAVLAQLVASGHVYSIERVKPLLDVAFERVLSLGYRNAHFRFGDGTVGWPDAAPFDRILITAGAPEVPRDLLMSHLAEGGLAILPVGPHEEQMLLEVRRERGELKTTDLGCPCRFVKLIGRGGWQNNNE